MGTYPPDTNVFEDYDDYIFDNEVTRYETKNNQDISFPNSGRRIADVEGEGVLTYIYANENTHIVIDDLRYEITTRFDNGAFPLLYHFDERCIVFVENNNNNIGDTEMGIKVK